MNEDKKLEKDKKIYTTPKIERLGKLSTLIQGATGDSLDAFPAESGTGPAQQY